MRENVSDLDLFPGKNSINLDVQTIRDLSPDSLSIREFRDQDEFHLSTKLFSHPFLSNLEKGWGLSLYGEELNMTRSHHLFVMLSTGYPVYEGGMIHHFTHEFSEPRYWIEEEKIRNSFASKRIKRIDGLGSIPKDLKNDYEEYRIAIRKIARSKDSRTLISTIIPPYSFAGNSLSVNFPFNHDANKYNLIRLSYQEIVCLDSLLNSFVLDHVLRSRINTNLNIFHLNELPVPRLRSGDLFFAEIVERAAKLICTTPEFDDLAHQVGIDSHQNGITDAPQRATLRAQIDGMIAHLYHLTESEFAHILSTFPIVSAATKQSALEAYRTFAPPPGDAEIATLITQGESTTLEFKSTARWNLKEAKKDRTLEEVILKTIAAFLNAQGGTLLIGVDDVGAAIGLAPDYRTLKSGKQNRDGFQLWLMGDLLLKELGNDLAPTISISFHILNGQDICKVIVNPAPHEVFVTLKDKNGQSKKCFFIRAGNSTRSLDDPSEMLNYIRDRWAG